MRKLLDQLMEYSDSDFYGFHMPGHKRNQMLLPKSMPVKIDITEIEGFDDLHHAEGILKDAQERAAAVYKADETHFLVNGSTVGILSAILGTTTNGDTVLVARNCHKSVYHAIYLNELKPVYLYPGFSPDTLLNTGISVVDVKEALRQNPAIKAVVIVSPTYDGVVSDVAAIAREAHDAGVLLIVDEAHGAHFGFHPYFPENSNQKHADIVIHSLHKTLPALTQTALLHINGERADRERVERYLDMLQSSSPSYVLMASIDSCIDLLDNCSEELFGSYTAMLARLRSELAGLTCLQLAEPKESDRSKIVISTKNTQITGRELYWMLIEDWHLQLEMAAGTYVLAMTSIGDSEEGMERLQQALFQIDRTLKPCSSSRAREKERQFCLPHLTAVYTSAQMERMTEHERKSNAAGEHLKSLAWQESIGYISTEYAYLYPPGIPLIVPGEKICQQAVNMLQWYQESEYSIEGLKDSRHIEVWTHG